MALYSMTRWWSKWEMMHQVFYYFGDVEPFLLENEDMSRATHGRLLGFFSDASRKVILQVQLAAIVDYGEPFVKGTYNLEGDGPLALRCYEIVDTIRASIHTANTPNVLAIAEKLSVGGPHTK